MCTQFQASAHTRAPVAATHAVCLLNWAKKVLFIFPGRVGCVCLIHAVVLCAEIRGERQRDGLLQWAAAVGARRGAIAVQAEVRTSLCTAVDSVQAIGASPLCDVSPWGAAQLDFLMPNGWRSVSVCNFADLVGSDICDSDAAVSLYVQGLEMLFSQL